MIPVKSTPGIGRGGIREKGRGGVLMCNIFDTL
jgi:hypothetical protein